MSGYYFAQHAARLAGHGYDMIPITHLEQRWLSKAGARPIAVKCPGKQPAMYEGWQQGCPREDWPAYAGCGVGILTKRTPALDIDILDEQLAAAIQAQAERVLGDAPIRIGQPPKRLMPFQLRGETFGKMKVTWRGLGDELHKPTSPPAVELLSGGENGGQQFVALGIHPGTRQPYQWHRDPDLDLPHDLLPVLDRDRAERFMRLVAGALRRLGATDVKLSGVQEEQSSTRVENIAAPQQSKHPAAAFLAKLPNNSRPARDIVADITAALERRGNHDEHYDDWIKIGLAIKAALPGAEGERIWDWWSSLSSKYDRDLTRKKWGTFKPHSVTAATIFWGPGR